MNIEERRAKGRENYLKNRDAYIARAKQHYAANKDKRLKEIRQWQLTNPEKRRAAARKYRANNPEICRERIRLWDIQNLGKFAAARSRWTSTNIEHVRAKRIEYRSRPENKEREKFTKKIWCAANLDRVRKQGRLQANRRRVRLEANIGECSTTQMLARIEYHGWLCRYCKQGLDIKTVTIDHLIPVSRNGSNWPSNMVPACKSCNSRKHKKTYREYMAILTAKKLK